MSVGVFDVATGDTREVANKSRTAIIDSEMSEESQNPLQNRVITQKITELNQSIEELNTLLNGMDETLGGKLDVSKIANNLVTTEEGYVLDARIGKALNDRVVSVDNLIKNAPFSMIHELQATATFEDNKAHISFSFNDTLTGLVIITGKLDGTETYICTILCAGTRYSQVDLVYRGGANTAQISLENDNTICVETNAKPTGLGTVKVTHIGSFG